jgi:cytochrome P450
LRNDADKIPKAVEESLRFEAPVVFLFRTAQDEAAIGGCPVHRGEHVMLGMAAANRDEDVYPDAESFRLDREDPAEHLSFGFGPHICLGNHLTRMIGRVALEELLAVTAKRRIELVDGYAWECVNHLQEYGPESLPITIRD